MPRNTLVASQPGSPGSSFLPGTASRHPLTHVSQQKDRVGQGRKRADSLKEIRVFVLAA